MASNRSGQLEPLLDALRGTLWTVLVLGAGALLGLLIISMTARKVPMREASRGASHTHPPEFGLIVERILPGVVSIDVERRFRHRDLGPGSEGDWPEIDPDFTEEEFEIPSSASGFVVDPQGYIITNDHVVRDGVRIDVTLGDGTTLPAELVGRDPMTDIAVLRVRTEKPLSAVPLGNSDAVRIGDWVVAIGNPLGMLEGSVTAGIVSAKGRSDLAIRGGSPTYQDFIQTDASINPGNSGGPLVNGRGEVVGVNTAFNAPGGGIGFAIAINMARQVTEQLIQMGRVPRAFLGVNLMRLNEDLAKGWGLQGVHGVVVTAVQAGTPAEEGGLQEGDVITEFDGMPVREVSPFRLLVAGSEVGRSVKVRYLRQGLPRTTEVRLAERSDPVPELPSRSEPGPSAEDLGMMLSPWDDGGGGGVLVDSVRADAPALRAGVRPGDLVLEVGWEEVHSPEALLREIRRSLDRRGVVVLRIQRGEARSFVAIRPR